MDAYLVQQSDKTMKQDQEARFLQDINQHIGIVHRVCHSYCAYDEEERRDLYQEIMYQLWKSYPQFQREAKFSTWMYKVALNTAITHRRKSRKDAGKEKLTEQYQQIAESYEQAQTEEKIQRLYQAINTLSDIDKAIVLLYLEDNSYQEIAAVTGLTKTNISVRLVRIKRTLEEKLRKTL